MPLKSALLKNPLHCPALIKTVDFFKKSEFRTEKKRCVTLRLKTGIQRI